LKLEVLQPGLLIYGIVPDNAVECVHVKWHGRARVDLTYKPDTGEDQKINLTREDEETISFAPEWTPRSKSAATRERILVKAAELFRDRGYDLTSLREIARHVEMNTTSLYYYFETKEDILQVVLLRGVATLHEEVATAIDGLPANATVRQKIETAIKAHLTCLIASGDFPATFSLNLQLPYSMRDLRSFAREHYFEFWLGLLNEGIANGEFRSDLDPTLIRRHVLLSLTRSVEWDEIDQLSIEQLSDFFSRLLFEGLH